MTVIQLSLQAVMTSTNNFQLSTESGSTTPTSPFRKRPRVSLSVVSPEDIDSFWLHTPSPHLSPQLNIQHDMVDTTSLPIHSAPPSEHEQAQQQDNDDSDALFAFHSALQADLHTGKSMTEAVASLFDSFQTDPNLPKKNQLRLKKLNLSAPILSAITNTPALHNDLSTVAQMCHTVYQLAEDEIESLRNIRERLELPISNISDIVKLVDESSKIIVVVGAGVSVSCGIPDFRSKGGLYDTVLERFGLSDPQSIFDLEEFKLDPSLFYSFAKDVMPDNELQPSLTHRFIAQLEKQGKLLRVYSQNIDGLETRAGVSEKSLVLCHGSFLTATCMKPTCRTKIEGHEIAKEVADGAVPICRKCVLNNDQDDEDEDEDGDDAESRGVLKPDIVFFGESLPKKVNKCLENDTEEADLVLVLGTSLQVAPVARIPELFRNHVPRILVNRETVDYDFDVELLGDCDVIIQTLKNQLKWDSDDSSKQLVYETDNNVPDVLKFIPPRRFIFKGATEESNGSESSNDSE